MCLLSFVDLSLFPHYHADLVVVVLLQTVYFAQVSGYRLLAVGLVYLDLDFVAAQVEFYHEEHDFLFFLSLQELWRVYFLFAKLFVILANWLVLSSFLLDSGLFVSNLHPMDCLLIPINGGTPLVSACRSEPITHKLRFEGTLV